MTRRAKKSTDVVSFVGGRIRQSAIVGKSARREIEIRGEGQYLDGCCPTKKKTRLQHRGGVGDRISLPRRTTRENLGLRTVERMGERGEKTQN